MTSLLALDGRCCLATGGGRGIGCEAARAFAAAGATVALGVGAPASVEAAVGEAARACEGRLDVLVNNAGINLVTPADAVTLDEWERAVKSFEWEGSR